VPYDVARSSPIQLSQQERSDLMELTGTDLVFFRQLATLLFKGALGISSQYERRRNAPPPRKSARLQQATKGKDSGDETGGSASSSQQPTEHAAPHAVRAYQHYLEIVPGFVPLHRRDGAITFQPSVSHLSVDRVHLAVRQLYLGSQVNYSLLGVTCLLPLFNFQQSLTSAIVFDNVVRGNGRRGFEEAERFGPHRVVHAYESSHPILQTLS
jgi:hypothetical protein